MVDVQGDHVNIINGKNVENKNPIVMYTNWYAVGYIKRSYSINVLSWKGDGWIKMKYKYILWKFKETYPFTISKKINCFLELTFT